MNTRQTIFAVGAAAGAVGALMLLRPKETGTQTGGVLGRSMRRFFAGRSPSRQTRDEPAQGDSVGARAAGAGLSKPAGRAAAPAAAPVAAAGTAAITGASSGIGAAFAARLAAAGYDLVLIARRGDRLAELVAELEAAHGIRVQPVVADLADEGEIERVAGYLAALPSLALLVNNAGVGSEGRFQEARVRPQMEMIRLHVLASVRLTHATLPAMIERGRGGIINVASIAGLMALPGNVQYCADQGLSDHLLPCASARSAGHGRSRTGAVPRPHPHRVPQRPARVWRPR